MNSRMIELQDSAAAHTQAEPKRSRVRYSQAEWELLAKATLVELSSDHQNWSLSMPALINQAQRNQQRVLLGEHYGVAEWSERHFTANDQCRPVMQYLHKFLEAADEAVKAHHNATRTNDELLEVASNENKQLQAKVTALEKQVATLTEQLTQAKTRKPDIREFSETDILSEAAFIQAERAERAERAATRTEQAMSKIEAMIASVKTELQGSISNQANEVIQAVEQLAKQPKIEVRPDVFPSRQVHKRHG